MLTDAGSDDQASMSIRIINETLLHCNFSIIFNVIVSQIDLRFR